MSKWTGLSNPVNELYIITETQCVKLIASLEKLCYDTIQYDNMHTIRFTLKSKKILGGSRLEAFFSSNLWYNSDKVHKLSYGTCLFSHSITVVLGNWIIVLAK